MNLRPQLLFQSPPVPQPLRHGARRHRAGGDAAAHRLARAADRGVLGQPHFAPKAKRIIYLFMSGGPSQLDLFDYKPLLNQRHGEQLPDSVRGRQRLTGMSGNQSSIPLVGSPFKFTQHGQAGAWFSELLPHTATIADDICVVRSMFTEAINHGPGVTFFQTGSQIAGTAEHRRVAQLRARAGECESAVVRRAHHERQGRPAARLASVGQRLSADETSGRAVPRGERSGALSRQSRRASARTAGGMMLDRLRELHEHQFAGTPDAEIQSRIDQYEMAFRMQTSIPEVTDLSQESAGDARIATARM